MPDVVFALPGFISISVHPVQSGMGMDLGAEPRTGPAQAATRNRGGILNATWGFLIHIFEGFKAWSQGF